MISEHKTDLEMEQEGTIRTVTTRAPYPVNEILCRYYQPLMKSVRFEWEAC